MIQFEDHPGAARPLCSPDATGDSDGHAAQAVEGRAGCMICRATTATRTIVLSRSSAAAVRWSDGRALGGVRTTRLSGNT